jgi:hypothetical protein
MGNSFRQRAGEVLMPWKECSVMEERLRFVARLLEGEGMGEVCRDFGISRKTGLQNRQPLQGPSARRARRSPWSIHSVPKSAENN